MNETIKELTIKNLLSSNEYRIPIYQRNYAWGLEETTQLIQDVADYAKDSPTNNYYIGNLIVFPRHENNNLYFETIDGQQRTTTITILLCALKHNAGYDLSWYSHVNLSFDHREKSNLALSALYNDPETISYSTANSNIVAVYNNTWSIVCKICKDKGISVSEFIDYLLTKVIILRISVPKDTNLNHYFEIMNSRGEQLEQHEIVKAQLMFPLKDNPAAMAAFNMIWEACSNMNRYVQMNFAKDTRIKLFENNGTEDVKISFADLTAICNSDSVVSDKNTVSLKQLFEDAANNSPYNKPWENNTQKEDQPETYHSLITFSNFLLHVLKIIRPDNEEIVLDDKSLTKIFTSVIHSEKDTKVFCEEFVMKLLEMRFLFDKYVIKRKRDKWSLEKLLPQKNDKDKYYYKDTFSQTESEDDESGQNRNIIILQSMFHVSAPTQTYKHWMNAALYYVYNNKHTSAFEYAEYLWNLAKAYMLDRYLAEEKTPFETIIFENNGNSKNTGKCISWSNINIDEYPQTGEHVENFVFNFYDYLLWKETKDKDFEFMYRTSVEHFFPQHPIEREPMDFNHLHSFGNLCLVSRGMNSRFTNNLPGAKYENFGYVEAMKTYSLKLKSMMNVIKEGKTWNETIIDEKEQEAKERICNALLSE